VERGRNFIPTTSDSASIDSTDEEDNGSGLENSSFDTLTVIFHRSSQVALKLSMSLLRPRFRDQRFIASLSCGYVQSVNLATYGA
jgi:hypothetical protein